MENNQLLSKTNSSYTNTDYDDFNTLVQLANIIEPFHEEYLCIQSALEQPIDRLANNDNDVSNLEVSPFYSDHRPSPLYSITWCHWFRRCLQEKESTVAVAETSREPGHWSETMAEKIIRIPYSLEDTSSKLESLKCLSPLQI